MTRLTDVDALIDKYQSECGVDVYRYEVIEDLRNAPTVDAIPLGSELCKCTKGDFILYKRKWLYEHLEQEFEILKSVRDDK